MARIAVVAHQANAPDAARQFAQTAAHFDVVFGQQLPPHGLGIHAIGDAHGGEGGQTEFLGHMAGQAQLRQPRPKVFRRGLVPLPAGL